MSALRIFMQPQLNKDSMKIHCQEDWVANVWRLLCVIDDGEVVSGDL